MAATSRSHANPVLRWDRTLIPPGERVLLAVSGGPDSLALLHCLAVQENLADRLAVCHVHHGMRAEAAEADIAFLQAACSAWKTPLTVSRADVPELAARQRISVEEAGRRARYEAFADAAAEHGCRLIATAHTADDLAETVLMNLFRGAGIDGLAGIPRRRPLFGSGGPRVIRPLLDTWRREIEEYCRAYALSPRLDVTNLDRRYRRSRIRLELMPQLEGYDPQLKRHLVRLSQQAVAERELLQPEAAALLDQATLPGGELTLDAAICCAAPPALARRALRLALRRLRVEDPDAEAALIERLLALARGELTQGFTLPGGAWRVNRRSGALQFRAAGSSALPVPQRRLICTLTEPPPDPRQPPDRVYLDADAVTPPLQLRTPRRGDRFQPLGAAGSRLLSDLFIDRKVPRDARATWPVVVDETGIIWVAGLAVAERCRVLPETRRCYRLELAEA